MDSYHFQFDRMNNLDLHPLSLPVSRLSPAKSSSSIDQYTHHHSKGDSAYSSFSGGSTVPDYPSTFVLDDIQSHSLHYTDLKYPKAKYSPTFPDSDSKTMDHLCCSMEAIAQGGLTSHTHFLPPPPPPVRLDSFVTTKNLENSRARESPEGQIADNSSSQQTSAVGVCGVQAKSVYGCVLSQHFQKNQFKQDLVEMAKPQKLLGTSNRLPLRPFQPDKMQQYRGAQSETQRKRSYSDYGGLASEQKCHLNSCNSPQNTTSGNIYHKGQFYFVTGVFNSSEPSVTQGVGDSANLETFSDCSSLKAQGRRQSCPGGPTGKLQEELKFSNQSDILEHPNNSAVNLHYKSEETTQDVGDQRVMSKENSRHHSSTQHIFYCGPENNTDSKMMTPALIKEDHISHPKKDEQILRTTQLDVPNEKISKETTPLLYHLTGANRASFTSKLKSNNDCGMGIKIPDSSKEEQKAEKNEQISPNNENQQSAISVKQPNEFFYLCSTLDDSYKKYYKEKLKDAQSKVLRETSFKRRDLQLSWPHRIKQQTDKMLSVPSSPPSQSMQPNIANLTPQLHILQQTEKENTKEFGQEMGIEKEKERPQNIAQPQVPRVGCRKRLTADQKKLSHSEPEKLHQLADVPAHMTCRSLGSEVESLLSESDLSLVAARRKMFETRGRALSASTFSKSTLKHFQQKALAAYMDRKTGHKVAEPQQPIPQELSHRHSTAGRLFDVSSRHNFSTAGSKKLHRPLSAGRILDSVSSSVKYAQFLHAQSNHSRQSSLRESPTPGRTASVENLLDQPESELFRARSISTPHAFQVLKHSEEFTTDLNEDFSSSHRQVERGTLVCHSHTSFEPDNWKARMMAPRGKSMEELGASKISRPEVLSKSSEQLDQLQGKQALSGKERRTVSFHTEGTHTEKKVFIPGEHTNNCLAGTGNKLSASSIKHLFSHDEIRMVPYIAGSKNRDDNIEPSHSAKVDEIKLEAGSKEQKVFLQDVSEMPVSDQEVSLSHGITTDPSLWISTPETNGTKAHNWPSSETAVVEPHITSPAPCTVGEPTAITAFPDIHEVESRQTPVVSKKQDRNEKKEDPCVIENKVPEGNGPKCKLEWDVLVQKVVSADQSLERIFYPITNRKTALMLMEQLLSEDTLLMEEHYKRKQEKKVNNSEEASHSTERPVYDKPANPLTSLNDGAALSNQKECNTEIDIIEKKRQLMAYIEKHLASLDEARFILHDNEKENGARGHAIETLVRENCMPGEVERYIQFIGDLERVVSLLLCLSARLARVQNALSTVNDNMDIEEKQSLDNRHHLLCKQRDDAKDLKDNLDRRERMVSTFLSKQLTDTQLQEYRHFIQTKASLLIRQKDLDERQRLGEEQLEALLNSIPR